MKTQIKRWSKGESKGKWNKLSATNKKLINDYTKTKKGYVTLDRLKSIKHNLVKFGDLLEIDFTKAVKDDITKAWGIILQSDFSIKTKQDYATDIRAAFKYWKGEDEYYPSEVAKIKRPYSKTALKLPDEMLSEEQVYQMIKACMNNRDKFYIAFCGLDGALRPIEALRLKWKDVKQDKYGFFINVHTAKKSGDKETRAIRVIKSEPYFIKWSNEYPANKDDEAFVFINYSNLKPISKNTIDAVFRSVKRKLNLKKCYPYLLRHSLITKMSKDPSIPISVLKKFVGHSLSTNTISEYQHFGDDDLMDMQLEYNGVKKKEEIPEEVKKPIKCPNCNNSNEWDAEFCSFCNRALSQKRLVADYEKTIKMKEEFDMFKKEHEELKQGMKKFQKLFSNMIFKEEDEMVYADDKGFKKVKQNPTT